MKSDPQTNITNTDRHKDRGVLREKRDAVVRLFVSAALLALLKDTKLSSKSPQQDGSKEGESDVRAK